MPTLYLRSDPSGMCETAMYGRVIVHWDPSGDVDDPSSFHTWHDPGMHLTLPDELNFIVWDLDDPYFEMTEADYAR